MELASGKVVEGKEEALAPCSFEESASREEWRGKEGEGGIRMMLET